MAQSWFADPELLPTSLSVSYVCNNLSKAGDTLVRRFAPYTMRTLRCTRVCICARTTN